MPKYLEPVRAWHVVELSKTLRQSDKDEIRAMADLDPLEGIVESVALSHVAYTMMYEGKPYGIFGARKIADDTALVWMMASDALESQAFRFLRECRKGIDFLHDEVGCNILCNYTDKRNILHHEWCRWMGFTLGDEVPFGPFDMPFYPIIKVRKTCAD